MSQQSADALQPEQGSARGRDWLGPYAVLVGNANLDVLFGGQVVSTLGDWIYLVALAAYAYTLTHSALVVAMLTFVRLLPEVVLLPMAGMLADRWDRQRIMIAADLGRALCMVGFLFVHSAATIWIAFPLIFVTTALTSLFGPALNSVLPSVVDADDLVEANSLMSQMDALALLLGPALAGALALVGQVQVAFLLNALSFLVSGVTLFFLRVPPRDTEAKGARAGVRAEVLDGFRFLFGRNDGVLAAYVLNLAGVALIGGDSWTLAVVFAQRVFHMGSQGAGILFVAFGAGGLLATLVVGPALRRIPLGRLFTLSVCANSLALVLFGLSPAGFAPLLFLAMVGLTNVVANVAGITVIQRMTPHELLGRVFGVFQSLLVLSMLFAALVVAPLIDAAGPRGAELALVALPSLVLLLSIRWLRRADGALMVRDFLRRVPVLSTLPQSEIDGVAARLELARFSDGATILRQGQMNDRLYIVRSGEADVVTADETGERVQLNRLAKMDYFGEISLLDEIPCTATVVATGGPVELYSLSRASFQALVQRSQNVESGFRASRDARYLNSQQKLLLLR